MALTAQEIKWFKSFMAILRERGVDTSSKIALAEVAIFQDLSRERQWIEAHGEEAETNKALQEDRKNIADSILRKAAVPAFIRPDDNNEILFPEELTDISVVDWIYENTVVIDDTRIQEDGSGLDAETEQKVKALYESAKNGRLFYCPNSSYDSEKQRGICVGVDGNAFIMEKGVMEVGNDNKAVGEKMDENEHSIEQVYEERLYCTRAIWGIEESEKKVNDAGDFISMLGRLIRDQKKNPQMYVSQTSAKRRALNIDAAYLSIYLEKFVDEECSNLRKNSDYTFGVMPLRSMEELGHPEMDPNGVYTSFDADIKCELKHINDAMQFKGQAAQDYVKKLQNSELFTNAMDSLNRISETVRVYESMLQRIPVQKQEEREYLTEKIYKMITPEGRRVQIEELEQIIQEQMREAHIPRDYKTLRPLVTQVEDLKNMDKLTHLVDVCSYLSCRKTLPTDGLRAMGGLPDELGNYLDENMPEWKPGAEVFAAAADWEIPESMEIDFDSFTNTIIQDGIHMPEMEGLTNGQKLSRIKEGLKDPDSTVYQVATEKLSGYIEGIVTERFKSLGMNMSLYMVPFNDCVIIDGKLVSDMFMDDKTSQFAYREGQEEDTKRKYLAEQLGKAFRTGRSVEIFLPDKDGMFTTTTKITAKGLKKEGIVEKEVDAETLLQAKGRFFVNHSRSLKGISKDMQEKLNRAGAGELDPNAYANVADAVIEDMRREKAGEYNIFTRGDNGMNAAEQVSELLGKAQGAQKSVWFGSTQYDDMVQAVERLNQLTAKMAGHIDPDNIGQMHEYKKALEEVRKKAEVYVEYKKDEENIKPKTQKRIDTATDISRYADDSAPRRRVQVA